MAKKTIKYLFLFFFFILKISANPDSLLLRLQKLASNDTNRISVSLSLASAYSAAEKFERAIEILEKASVLAHDFNLSSRDGILLNKLGDIYYRLDNYVRAREYYSKSISTLMKDGNSIYLANAYNDLGNLEESEGNYNNALIYFFKYLALAEKYNSLKDVAIAYNNIAIIFSDMGEYKKELAYNYKSLKIREQLKEPLELSASYNNLGVSYQSLENYPMSLYYFHKSLDLRKQHGDVIGTAACYHNIAICYKQLKRFSEAEENYKKALKLQDSLGEKSEATLTRINIARLFLETGEYRRSTEILSEALKHANQLRSTALRADAHEALHETYGLMKDHEKAFAHFRKYIELRDSLSNIEQSKEFTRIEMQNQFDRDLAKRQAEQAKKDEAVKQEKKQQRIIITAITIVLLIILFFLIWVYKNFREKRAANLLISRQKKEVEEQKNLIEEKQKEIIDSINYAQRIQSAILASESDIRALLPESFLLYKPKDIVAGDFYFFECTETHIFYAAADCTGHGVPGALVSVVCANALTRCVKEFSLTDPGKILDKTRELVVETFKKSADNVKDGMDISLIAINRKSLTGTEKIVHWAGANNPLWVIKTRNGIPEFGEIKANKQPIGLTEFPSPFITHQLHLLPGDSLFLFTDGYADQFGGPAGKKFKYRQFENVLMQIFELDADTQKEHVNKSFEDWRMNTEQVDDVLVIGIKF